MNQAPIFNPLDDMMACPTKSFYKMVVNAESKYKKAIKESMFLIMPAMVISMYENSQVRWDGITRWKKTLIQIIEECSADPNMTIFQVLEDETGLELQIGDGKSFHDVAFANPDIFDRQMNNKNPKKWILYFQKKAQWSTVTVMAACLLACNRQFNWAPLGKMNVIREQTEFIMDCYQRKAKPLHAEFEKVTGHKAKELWEDVKQ